MGVLLLYASQRDLTKGYKMNKTELKTVIVNGNVAKYRELIEDFNAQYFVENERRFMRALRKASGFTGRGLTTRGNSYGRDIGNRTMSVYGTFEIRFQA